MVLTFELRPESPKQSCIVRSCLGILKPPALSPESPRETHVTNLKHQTSELDSENDRAQQRNKKLTHQMKAQHNTIAAMRNKIETCDGALNSRAHLKALNWSPM